MSELKEMTPEHKSELDKLMKQFHDALHATYVKECRTVLRGDNTMDVGICAMAGLMQVAANIGVDLNIPPERFIGLAAESWKRSVGKVQRFA